MTAQLNDRIELDGEAFDLAGIRGEALFQPQAHGLEPQMLHTACWRGFVCTYGLDTSKRLVLRRLGIGLAPEVAQLVGNGGGPRLGGKLPNPVEDQFEGWQYENLSIPVEFTGGMLAASDFIRELYVHMGFHPAWKYKRVIELSFEAGQCTGQEDRSVAMAEIREKLSAMPRGPQSREEVEGWIKRCFSREY